MTAAPSAADQAPGAVAPPLVRFEHVSASYGGPAVLNDVSLSIARGAFVGVVGPSGAGKTTLLKAMVGMVPRLRGTVTVDGRVAGSGGARNVGWVPQLETVDWNFPATVREVVLMGRWGHHPWRPWMSREDRADADRVLERLGIAGLGDRQVRQLSGGQQQRVFLARAMIGDPALLLLDEPTSGVDIKTRDEVLHLLADLNRAGTTIVMTTHELNSVAAHLPWVVCVNRRIVAEGDPDRIFTAPVLNATYNADLRIVRQDGAILVADAAPHTLREALRHRHDGYEHSHHEHDHEPHVHPHEHGDPAVPAPVPHEHAPVPHEHEGVPHVHDAHGHPHPMELITEPLGYEFFRMGLAVSVLVGLLCGLIGVYVVLRHMSYIGHGLSHAVFGGAVVAYVASVDFYLGAGTWAFASALIINAVARSHRVGADAAIGIVTTASFAVGVALISMTSSFTTNFEAALFGNILGVTPLDLAVVFGVTVAVAGLIVLFYKQLLFVTFDPEVAPIFGVRSRFVDSLFALMLAATIVASINVVGVTLIAATLIIPATTARLMTDSFAKMLVYSAVLGAVSGAIGMYLSYWLDISSGATIVLLESSIFVLVFAYSAISGRRQVWAPVPGGDPLSTHAFDD